MKRLKGFLVCFVVLLSANSAGAEILHVPDDYLTIQAGIDAASDGDTVLVADGEYTGESNRNLDFHGKAIVVKSENGPQNCIIDCGNSARGFHFHSGEGTGSVINGFTIQNGNYGGFYEGGGGILCSNSSSPTIVNNSIRGNSSEYYGGGICCRDNSHPNIVSNILTQNHATYGGGICCKDGSSPTITGNTITENSSGYGGGIGCFDDSSPMIVNNVITGNSATVDFAFGGGIFCDHSSPTIDKNIVTENSSYNGGGIFIYQLCNPIITNNIIAENTSAYSGGIFCGAFSLPTLTNNTITENTADYYGGGICIGEQYSSTTLVNTILWNNSPQEIYFWYDNNTITVSYSDIQEGQAGIVTNGSTVIWGDGNIDADPMFVFVDPANPSNPENDYHLQPGSPCIDAGTTSGAPTEDLEGNPRDAAPDMGAYEFILVNEPPIADAGPDQEAILGESVQFDGSGSSDPDGDIVSYQWDFGDGTPTESGAVVSHAYSAADTYTVTLTVIDDDDANGTDTATVTVLTPEEAIDDLIEIVENLGLQQGIENSLGAKLENAQDALAAANAENRNDAISKMEAFINAVEAQRGKKLTEEQASELVEYASRIILALGGGSPAPAIMSLLPQATYLLLAYPIPANPDVWIPYHLNSDSEVVISIHAASGRLIRTLDLGHQTAGYYTSKSKAAYWDGRNETGEPVASGIYFYTIQAGDFTATKKMVIAR